MGVTLGKGELVVSKLQPFLDEWLASHPESHIDYVHEERNVVSLARNAGTVGFLFDCISKNDLFSAVGRCGSLPRKTFSMGVSRDKRYYLEARKIVPDTINI